MNATGYVSLPPQAIKDAEKVGRYNQIFVLGECQDGAVELGELYAVCGVMWRGEVVKCLVCVWANWSGKPLFFVFFW